MFGNVPGDKPNIMGKGRDHDIKVWGLLDSTIKKNKFMITDTFGHYEK